MESSNHSQPIHLHNIDLDAPHSAWQDCCSLLDHLERSRAKRFRSHTMRRRWTVARAGLRGILASHCGCSTSNVEFATGEFGKPELSGAAAASGFRFNLSHSGNMAVVAVAPDFDVGIDIELKKPIRDWPGVAARFFAPKENVQLMALEEPRRIDAFFDCWTRKEALIKATGEGLSARLDEFEVSLSADANLGVVADHSDEQKYIGWRLENVNIGPHFAGAIAMPARVASRIIDHGGWQFADV